jgi:hypothetical protein
MTPPPLRWLLGELTDGQPLTQTGNLNRALVQAAAGCFGWWDAGLHGLPRSEDELYDLRQVRQLGQRLGLIRRSGRRLVLTTSGRTALHDPEGLWRRTAARLLPADPFALTAGEATHATTNLLRALNLLAIGGDWADRAYGLTPTARSIAHEALQRRATGPKASPWG